MKVTRVAASAALLVVVANVAWAQNQRMPNRQAPQTFTSDFVAMAQKVATALQVRIVVDPTIFVATPPTEPKILDTPDATVAAMVSGLKDVSWRKVYLMQSESASGLRAERLAAIVRALDTLETGGVVLENPATRRAMSVQKNLPVLPGFGEELRQRQFDPNAVYVIYSTLGGGTGKSAEDRFLDLQRQQLELMMQMDPDALAETFAKGMQMWSSLDPQTQSRLFGNMMRAGTQMFMNMSPEARTNLVGSMVRSGMEMWASMPPDQRARITQEMMQMGQQLMGQFGGPGGGRPPR